MPLLGLKIFYPNQAEYHIEAEIQYPALHKSLADIIQLPRINVNRSPIIVVRKYLIVVLFKNQKNVELHKYYEERSKRGEILKFEPEHTTVFITHIKMSNSPEGSVDNDAQTLN